MDWCLWCVFMSADEVALLGLMWHLLLACIPETYYTLMHMHTHAESSVPTIQFRVLYYVAIVFVRCACLYGGTSRSDTWHDRTMFGLCVWCVWPEVWTALTGSLSLLISFRTSQSLTRFWESRRDNFWNYMQRPHGWQLNNSSANHVTPTACEPLVLVCNFCVVLLPCFQQKAAKDGDLADVLRKGQACYIKCEVISGEIGKIRQLDRKGWFRMEDVRRIKDSKVPSERATKELKKQSETHVEGLETIQAVLQDLKMHYAHFACSVCIYCIYIYICYMYIIPAYHFSKIKTTTQRGRWMVWLSKLPHVLFKARESVGYLEHIAS